MTRRKIAPYRIGQIVGTVLLNGYILAYLQGKILYSGFLKHIPEPVLNCYGGPLALFACPIGSAQQILGQQGIDWLHRIPWLPLGVFVVVGALVGRAACGWVCPFGLWQDLLYKIKAGARGGWKKWLSFGIIGGIGLLAVVLLSTFLRVVWWKSVFFAWLPFVAAVLFVMVRGKFVLPSKLWLGGWLAGVGLGVFTWFKFEPSFGVAAGVLGMTAMGLAGGWYAFGLGVPAVFLVGVLGPNPVAVGPLDGSELALAAVLVTALLVVVLDRLVKVVLPATMLKFAYLFVVAGVVAYFTGEPWFCKLCPQGTFGAGIPLVLWDPVGGLRQLVGWLYYLKLGILFAVVAAAIAIKRPFCRIVCPIGAVYSVFNKGSLMHMKLEKAVCTECGVCRKVCPMDIEPQQGPNQLECIRCFECVWKCPKSGLKIRV